MGNQRVEHCVPERDQSYWKSAAEEYAEPGRCPVFMSPKETEYCSVRIAFSTREPVRSLFVESNDLSRCRIPLERGGDDPAVAVYDPLRNGLVRPTLLMPLS